MSSGVKEKKVKAERPIIRRLTEIDWDFPDQASDSEFSDLHWHPCRFPSQIPAIAIGRLTVPGDTILDPFVGSGTTVVEAQRLGRNAVGIDINPISCLMTRAKLTVESKEKLAALARSVRTFLLTKLDRLPSIEAPPAVQKRKWYTRRTAQDLEKLWAFIHQPEHASNLLLQAAFSAILLSACREERHWGYICDNSTPKSQRQRDVVELFCGALDRFVEAMMLRDTSAKSGLGHCEVVCGDSATVLRDFPKHHFSCFITSPPYFGVADYVKSQRLSMEWFGLEIEPSRLKEIGARSKRHRKTADTDYVGELSRVFEEVHRVLKPRAYGLLVYGESPARASTLEPLIENLNMIGYEVVLDQVRQIREGRRQVPSIKAENVIIVRKR